MKKEVLNYIYKFLLFWYVYPNSIHDIITRHGIKLRGAAMTSKTIHWMKTVHLRPLSLTSLVRFGTRIGNYPLLIWNVITDTYFSFNGTLAWANHYIRLNADLVNLLEKGPLTRLRVLRQMCNTRARNSKRVGVGHNASSICTFFGAKWWNKTDNIKT